MATCNPSDLVQAGKGFLGMTGVQREGVMLALLCQILHQSNPMASCDPTSLVQDAKCFLCLTPDLRQAIMVQLLCEILQGGGSGGTCIVCLAGSATPVAAATCPCSIAYNGLGQFWFWDSLTASWFPISL